MRLRELLSVRTLIIAALPFLALPPLLLFPLLSFYTFYTNTIPKLHHTIPLSLSFFEDDWEYPRITGTAPIPDGLRPQTAYLLTLALKVPPTPANLKIGNFMVHIGGLLPNGQELIEATRIPYRTPWVRTLRTALWSPFYVTGLLREEETVLIDMGKLEEIIPQERINIKIERVSTLSTYECELELAVELYGWKAFLKKFRVPVAIVFMSMFVGIELITAAWTWWRVGKWLELGDYRGDPEDLDEPVQRIERRESHRGEIREPLEDPIPNRAYLTPSPTPSVHEDEGHIGDDEGGITQSTGSDRRRSEGLRNRRRSS